MPWGSQRAPKRVLERQVLLVWSVKLLDVACLVITDSCFQGCWDMSGVYALMDGLNRLQNSTIKVPRSLAPKTQPVQALRIHADPITSYLQTISMKYSEIRPNIRKRRPNRQIFNGKTKNLQRTCRCSQSLRAAKLTKTRPTMQCRYKTLLIHIKTPWNLHHLHVQSNSTTHDCIMNIVVLYNLSTSVYDQKWCTCFVGIQFSDHQSSLPPHQHCSWKPQKTTFWSDQPPRSTAKRPQAPWKDLMTPCKRRPIQSQGRSKALVVICLATVRPRGRRRLIHNGWKTWRKKRQNPQNRLWEALNAILKRDL